jgi:Zn-dependent protease
MYRSSGSRRSGFGKLTLLFRLDGVDVYFHWSVFVIAGFFLLGSIQRPGVTVTGLLCYLGMLLIHEFGHVIAARRLGCAVFGIELYPIFGFARFGSPWSRFDHCIIAWGGVLAQAVVAIPMILWVSFFGFTHSGPINAMLALLGFVSAGIALFNLLPLRGLDGATAWEIVPLLFRRMRSRRSTGRPTYRR